MVEQTRENAFEEMHGNALAAGTDLDTPPVSLRWLLGGKVRLSVTVGVVAGLIVAVGFLAFDLGRQRWVMKQRYPHAATSYERNLLYARDLVRQGECERAEPLLRKLAGREEGTGPHADALVLLARCLSRSENHLQAESATRETYERFIAEYAADPRVPMAQMRIAESYSESGLYSESNARYMKLLRMITDEDKKAEIEFLIAKNHYQAGDVPAAIDLFRQVRQKYDATPAARDSSLQLGQALADVDRPEEAERVLRSLVEEAPGSAHAAAALRMLAKHALDAGAYGEAVAYAGQWLRQSPTPRHQVDVMLILGRAWLGSGEPERAEAVASDIITFFRDSPELDEAYVLRGETQEILGHAEDAEIAYQLAAEVDPSNPAPREHLSRLYLSQDRLPEAIEQLTLACRAAPEREALFIELAKLYRRNSENVKAEQVLTQFTRERGLSSSIGEAYLLLSDIQLDLDHSDDAYKTLDRLLAIGTTTVSPSVVLARQGDILAGVGLYEDALEKYRSALEVGGNAEDVKPEIARVFLAAGYPEECLNQLEAISFSAFPVARRFDVLELKARALSELSMYSDTRRVLREAIALRSGRENFSTLALLMHTNVRLQDERGASQVYEATLKIIRSEQGEAAAEARRIVLDWADYLYRQGEYSRAAEVYSTVEPPQFPEAEVAWALYQNGNCRYYMSDFTGANEAYDRLAREFSTSEWVGYAEQRRELIRLQSGA